MKSSSGINNVNNILVKKAKEPVCPHLVQVINISFSAGKFPNLKKAKVLRIDKSRAKDDVNNYRPISLLVLWSKIFERVMYNRLYSSLESSRYIHENQFPKKKNSTIDAIAKLLERIRGNCTNMRVATIFLDLKKAFDTIGHDILIFTLERYGIRGNCSAWIKDYLTNRQQCVEVNNFQSQWQDVCRISQWSILGPLFWCI